jgi:hypothetical protein
MIKVLTAGTITLALLVVLVACGSQPAPGAATPQSLPAGALVVVNGLAIDGTGADPIPDGLVAVQGGRIVAPARFLAQGSDVDL